MEKIILGYYIGSDVHFDIKKRMLINVNASLRSGLRPQVLFRETMFRLFMYLIENANGAVINDCVLLSNVWDKYGLNSSNQRLWQVMNALKHKMKVVGMPDDFIMRVESKGYYVRENMIIRLYGDKIQASDLSLYGHQSDIYHP